MGTITKEKVIKGLLNISIRQVAGVFISTFGTIFLARWLGLEVMGIYAISSFFINIFSILLDLGSSNSIIRSQDEITEEFLKILLTVKLGVFLFLGAVLIFICAPLLVLWYKSEMLYWLLIASFFGISFSSFIKPSQSLLEKHFEYDKLSVLEISSMISFYIPSVTLAYLGFGVYSLAIGELTKGFSSVASFYFRPFKLGLKFKPEIAREILKYGVSYLSSVFSWMISSGINPIVVGKIAGLNAVGILRVSEGIINNLTFFKSITDRMAYPLLAEAGTNKEGILAGIEEGRNYQFLLGIVPLFVFTSFGYLLIPLLYGNSWLPVANILPLQSLYIAINCFFGLYSAALITAGKNWQVTKFHLTHNLLLWTISPITVYYFGYLGLPVAFILSVPSYFLIHTYFVCHFGNIRKKMLPVVLLVSWFLMLASWSQKNLFISFCFLFLQLGLFYSHRPFREIVNSIVFKKGIKP